MQTIELTRTGRCPQLPERARRARLRARQRSEEPSALPWIARTLRAWREDGTWARLEPTLRVWWFLHHPEEVPVYDPYGFHVPPYVPV